MFELGEFLLRILEGIGMLRYVTSPTYRKRTRDRWKTAARITIVADIMGGVIGAILLLVIIVIIIRYTVL
jgi:hypothetical protein